LQKISTSFARVQRKNEPKKQCVANTTHQLRVTCVGLMHDWPQQVEAQTPEGRLTNEP
jgi:hypothetical protein